jgi:hypothetical protein
MNLHHDFEDILKENLGAAWGRPPIVPNDMDARLVSYTTLFESYIHMGYI